MNALAPSLAVLSLTWREASTETRNLAAAPLAAHDVDELARHGAHGVVQVHTCARSMWVLSAHDASWAGALLQAHVSRSLRAAGSEVLPALLVQDDALDHLFRVSLGLDSLVEGEAEIGGQVVGAFQLAGRAGLLDATLQATWRVLAELRADARREAIVRPGRGMGQLAVETLLREGILPSQRVGVVGLGSIGTQVRASLARAGFTAADVYTRTPRLGAASLDAIARADVVAWVVCTSAPAAWFVAPRPSLVIDLGRPAQALVPGIGLDALFRRPGLCLPPAQRVRAEELVKLAQLQWHSRARLRSSHAVLGRIRSLRDAYVHEQLPALLDDALADVPAATRKKVLAAAQAAASQYGRAVLDTVKRER